MKVFGQPDSYSDMLERMFYMCIVSGLICTLLLADASPDLKVFLNSVTTEADIGPLKNLKALYVLLPLLIAVVSRVVKLHDRISDLFRIRHVFDTQFILYPLAAGSGVPLTDTLKKKIAKKRDVTMYAVFYPYASFRDPKIDRQLVQTSADHWGWYWVFVESAFLFAVTTTILAHMAQYTHVRICLVVLVVELLFLLFLGFACRSNAQAQVDAILKEQSRRDSISAAFYAL